MAVMDLLGDPCPFGRKVRGCSPFVLNQAALAKQTEGFGDSGCFQAQLSGDISDSNDPFLHLEAINGLQIVLHDRGDVLEFDHRRYFRDTEHGRQGGRGRKDEL